MPARPVLNHEGIHLELPAELVNRVRIFAKKDMRSIKATFIRALELLLETYDKPIDQKTAGLSKRTKSGGSS